LLVVTGLLFVQSQLFGQTLAIFGGSFSVIPASEEAKDYWVEKLGIELTNYGVGGAGFSNLSQPWAHKHIQWQIDQACTPEAPVYDIYLLWASTNDFTQCNEKKGSVTDYTEADGYDESHLDTQCGGINYAISQIRKKAPEAKILFFTSIKCFTQIGKGTDPDYQGENGLNSFVELQKQCCQQAGVPYLDLFELCPITLDNYKQYIESDNLHMNRQGYALVKELQTEFISKYIVK